MREIKIPEPGAVGRDGWFGYRCGAVIGWAHMKSVVCYIARPREGNHAL